MTNLVILLVVLLAVIAIVIYNRLVRGRNRVDSAWSDIDVQLQRRHDLIPRRVTAVEQYGKFEKATLEAVTELRAEAMRVTTIDQRGERAVGRGRRSNHCAGRKLSRPESQF